MTEFGIVMEASPGYTARLARDIEVLGFDVLLCPDTQNLSPDPFGQLALAAHATTRLKLGVQQNRVYQLAIALPSSPSSAEVEAEAAGILDSFKCFPINIICISQSNKGIVPVAGSCY